MAISSSPTTRYSDLTRVVNWLNARGIGEGPATDIRVLRGGTQNVLIRFTRNARGYVLRRPPEQRHAESDSAILREARILDALDGTDVPHPRLVAVCTDPEIIGAVFSVTTELDGFNPTDAVPPAFAADTHAQHSLGMAVVDGLLELSRIDPVALGLSAANWSNGWLERQAPRWRGHLESYRAVAQYDDPDPAGFADIEQWLNQHRPTHSVGGLIHGDFHLGNILARAGEPGLAGFVDWELSTHGDPLLDFGHLVATWPGAGAGVEVPLARPMPGLPTAEELRDAYLSRAGRSAADVIWFEVLARFRLAVILEGTVLRGLTGQAPQATADDARQRARGLIAHARELTAST